MGKDQRKVRNIYGLQIQQSLNSFQLEIFPSTEKSNSLCVFLLGRMLTMSLKSAKYTKAGQL